MTFEEFFNKKRIDLVALKAEEPVLFAEFEKHFNQMGEKSFDHTKKYWFNKLRLQYHLAPELKPEKMHQENQLAEQTIVETLTDSIPAPTTGFKPRFKAGMVSKPTEEQKETPAETHPEVNAETPAVENTAPKPAFKPRFKPGMKGKPAEPVEYKPKTEPKKEETEETPSAEVTAPKPGFKPRFNMKTMAAKPAEAEGIKPETQPAKVETEATTFTGNTAPKPGFKPRFNMKMVTPKPAEDIAENKEETAPLESAEDKPVETVEPTTTTEAAAPKVGFKPRFNAKTTKPQTPPEE